MIKVARLSLSLTAYMFGLFQMALGILWLNHYDQVMVGVLALAIYFVATTATILAFKGLTLPSWMALLNVAAAVLIPAIADTQVKPGDYGTYATWYVGGLGILLGATALRGQSAFAWVGTLLASSLIIIEESASALFQSGLVGVVLLVLVGESTNKGLVRAERDIEKLIRASEQGVAELARAEATRRAQAETFGRSRSQIETLLKRVIATKGKLSEEERLETLVLETELRNEILGGCLMTESMRAAIRLARLRGVEVIVMDEGGMGGVQKPDFDDILERIVQVVNDQPSGKVNVRSPKGENWRVTVNAYKRGSVTPNVQIRL